jgi:hypothetical protein
VTVTPAAAAIERSITHNEIVTIRNHGNMLTELIISCDDYVDTNKGLVEFWGKTDEGSWRVHVKTATHS